MILMVQEETHSIVMGNLQGATVYVNGVAQTADASGNVTITIPSASGALSCQIGIKAPTHSDTDLNSISITAKAQDTSTTVQTASFTLISTVPLPMLQRLAQEIRQHLSKQTKDMVHKISLQER